MRGVPESAKTAGTEPGGANSGAGCDLPTEDLLALRAVVEGTATSTDDEFFKNLVRHLAAALDVHYAFVAEFSDTSTRVRSLAFWSKDHIHQNIEWELAGTPCADVVRGALCHYSAGVMAKFPHDELAQTLGIESYLGVPLLDAAGNHLGHLAVFDERPLPERPQKLLIFRIFAARAAAELSRLRLVQTLRDSEQRYRDLYDEAPIAYVLEDMEARFVSANRAALDILGLQPDEVPGTVGTSFVPDTPEAQQRVRDALAAVRGGAVISGVVLELRRKDNGRPVWIRWWSKPDRTGKYTRTMFLDVTEHVLLEKEQARLQAQNLYLQEEIKSVHNFEEIIGQSPALTAVLDKVSQVAATDASVLIYGETGTGKELIARAIHSASNRKDKPLIKVNCAALPIGLVESELFGHEKGAFTGALAKRIGRFELANGGTIFLDEVGEIPLPVQAKLLRVLQERECERVGGNTPIPVEVRVIAASNRDLAKAIREQTFREDLYYRLNVFPLALPPLRERPEDIPLLAQFFANEFSTKMGKRLQGLDRETIQRLVAYPWPGNVRELANLIERAVILARGPRLEIGPDLLPASAAVAADSDEMNLAAMQRNLIVTVLERVHGVIDGPHGAAKTLGLHPNTLRSRMKKLGITRGGHEVS